MFYGVLDGAGSSVQVVAPSGPSERRVKAETSRAASVKVTAGQRKCQRCAHLLAYRWLRDQHGSGDEPSNLIRQADRRLAAARSLEGGQLLHPISQKSQFPFERGQQVLRVRQEHPHS